MSVIMIFLSAQEPPKLPTLIENVIETQKEPPQPEKQITWKDNPQSCNEDTHWIASEAPYYCIPKKVVQTTALSKTPVRTANNASDGWFSYGWCTYFVSTQRPVGQWNNARDWFWQAQRDGWATGYTPQVGAIAQKGNHVAIVRAVSGNNMTIQEMNYEGFGVISSRTIPFSGWRFIY